AGLVRVVRDDRAVPAAGPRADAAGGWSVDAPLVGWIHRWIDAGAAPDPLDATRIPDGGRAGAGRPRLRRDRQRTVERVGRPDGWHVADVAGAGPRDHGGDRPGRRRGAARA